MRLFKKYSKLNGDTETEIAIIKMLDDIAGEINSIKKALDISTEIFETLQPRILKLERSVRVIKGLADTNIIYGNQRVNN